MSTPLLVAHALSFQTATGGALAPAHAPRNCPCPAPCSVFTAACQVPLAADPMPVSLHLPCPRHAPLPPPAHAPVPLLMRLRLHLSRPLASRSRMIFECASCWYGLSTGFAHASAPAPAGVLALALAPVPAIALALAPAPSPELAPAIVLAPGTHTPVAAAFPSPIVSAIAVMAKPAPPKKNTWRSL